MTDAELINNYLLWLGVAAVVVVIAAALLIAVLLMARRIERGAGAALGIVEQVRQNTLVIWALQETNSVAGQLQGGAEAILQNAGAIAQALHDADTRRAGGGS